MKTSLKLAPNPNPNPDPNPNPNQVKTSLKLVLRGAEERVVGLHCIGPSSDEMMQGFAVAIRMGATRRDFEVSK